MTFGAANDPSHFLIYLNLTESSLVPAECEGFARKLWSLASNTIAIGGLSNAGVAMVTRRPRLYPAAYGEISYRDTLEYTKDQWPPAGAGELNITDWHNPVRDRWDCKPILMSHEVTGRSDEARASSAYHGLMHGIARWQHPPTRNDGPIDGSRARLMWAVGVMRCAAVAARYRK